MRENAGWALIVLLMLASIVFLHGCSGAVQHSTGQLTCLGFCEFSVAKRRGEVITEMPDGTVVTEVDDTSESPVFDHVAGEN